MPNWCENILEISGPAEDIKRFKEFAGSEENECLDANKFIPYPEEYKKQDEIVRNMREKEDALREMADYNKMDSYQQRYFDFKNPRNSWNMKDGYNSGGYEWNINNWGSKWNFCQPELFDEGETHLWYSFESAWSPLCQVIIKMAEMFPTLSFVYKYAEPGVGFAGMLRCKNGETVEDVSYDWNMKNESFLELAKELLGDNFFDED